MTVADLKRMVREANLELVERGLVFGTFGNASGIERDLGLVVIKPSGVPYGDLSPDDMAVVSLESGEHLEGLKPSSDTSRDLPIVRDRRRCRPHPFDMGDELGASSSTDPVPGNHARRLLQRRRPLHSRPDTPGDGRRLREGNRTGDSRDVRST